MENNGLRDASGALIGGLIVDDYNKGFEDFEASSPPPSLSSPSYDLGRQRAAQRAEDSRWFEKWQADRDAKTDAGMGKLLTPEQYAEYRSKIDAIRKPKP